MFIHERKNWHNFSWQTDKFLQLFGEVKKLQGELMRITELQGFDRTNEKTLSVLTENLVKSFEIEGEEIDDGMVRSSIAGKLGLDAAGLPQPDKFTDGIVEMTLDATQNFTAPLTEERLFGWHAAMFPTGRSGMHSINVGKYRRDEIFVGSNQMGSEIIYFSGPAPERVPGEMKKFLAWINSETEIEPVLRAAIAHFWFVTIHPFDDGNGRIARAITDMMLARSDGSALRFYSMTAQIQKERSDYYRNLELSQRGTSDITDWIIWFLECLHRAIGHAVLSLNDVIGKKKFWDEIRDLPINDRQKDMLNRLLPGGGFVGKLTTSKWAKIFKCSPDTALNDINDLIEKKLLEKSDEGGRSTNYKLGIRKYLNQ